MAKDPSDPLTQLDWYFDWLDRPQPDLSASTYPRLVVEAMTLGLDGLAGREMVASLGEEIDLRDLVLYLLGMVETLLESRNDTPQALALRIATKETS